MYADNKPQPLAGFTVGTLTNPNTRPKSAKRKSTNQLIPESTENEKIVRLESVEDTENPAPLVRKLTPMSDLLESLLETENNNISLENRKKIIDDDDDEDSQTETDPPPSLTRRLTPMSDLELFLENTPKKEKQGGLVYFPAKVDVDTLQDWKDVHTNEQNNNNSNKNGALRNGAVVNVNNTEIAVFKYGDSFLATSEKCPHAGGPLHLGDIEVLPDKSLCVRCPWHKWTFCISTSTSNEPSSQKSHKTKVGSCIHPCFREDKKLKVFPTEIDKNRNHIKIGFESITKETLMDETF